MAAYCVYVGQYGTECCENRVEVEERGREHSSRYVRQLLHPTIMTRTFKFPNPNHTVRLDYVLIGLGLLFLALGYFHTAYNYLPELEDWNAYYVARVSVSSDVVGDEVYLRFPLPDVNAYDLNSIRVTIGSGSLERLLPSWVDVDDNELYVRLTVPSSTFYLRVYYGNPDAEPLSPEFVSERVYKAPPFDPDDYVIRYCDDDGWHGIFRFVGESKVYLTKWDDECGSMVLSREIPERAVVSLRLKAKGWGEASVRIFLSPTTSVSPEPDDWPEDYLEIAVVDDGHPRVRVVSDGDVVNEDAVCNNRYFWVYLYPNGDSYDVYSGNSYLGTIPRSGSYLVFGVEEGDGEILLKDLKVEYPVVDVDVDYTGSFPAPKAPSIEVVSPRGVLSDSNVHVQVLVFDPNDDVESVEVSLDGNLIYSGDSNLDTYVELNDGSHSLRAEARDSEGATAVSTVDFVVDTQPPEVNVSVEQNDGNVIFDVNASDFTDLTCTYSLDGNEQEFNCDSFVISLEGCGEHALALSICDQAGNCYEATYTLGEPCPIFGGGGGGGTRYVLKEKVVEKNVYIPVYLVSEGTAKKPVQVASPIGVSSAAWWLVVAVVLFLVFHMAGAVL